MNRWGLILVLSLSAGLAVGGETADQKKSPSNTESSSADPTTAPQSVLDFTVQDIDGKEVHLRKRFAGDVLLIVNVASKCGLTPQYAGLQRLYEKYRKKGFAVLGFPANQFGGQEPGTNAEIKRFCTTQYGVTFPMFAKIVVKGKGIHPLYRFLTQQQPEEKFRGAIEWNFAKFLIGRDGRVIGRFHPRVEPEDPKLIAAIEAALAAPRPASAADSAADTPERSDTPKSQ